MLQILKSLRWQDLLTLIDIAHLSKELPSYYELLKSLLSGMFKLKDSIQAMFTGNIDFIEQYVTEATWILNYKLESVYQGKPQNEWC